MRREVTEKHPSFGVVRITRPQGHATLFDSAFKHQHYITLEIDQASRRRDLNRDWIHGEEALIRVAMSEAQFAHMICSVSIGEGTPCTIERLMGKGVERCPDDETRQKFHHDVSDDIKEINATIHDIVEQISAITGQKGTIKVDDKRKLTGLAQRLEGQVRSSLPFVETSYIERLDSITQEAKTIVESHIIQVCERRGIPLSEMPPLQLQDPVEVTQE
jgi:hypothetical protein